MSEILSSPSALPPKKTKKAKAKSFPFDLVVCWWDDAHSNAGWQEAAEVKIEPCIVTTVGFLYRQDEEYVLIADSIVEFGGTVSTISGTTQVPKGMIKALQVIKKGKVTN